MGKGFWLKKPTENSVAQDSRTGAFSDRARPSRSEVVIRNLTMPNGSKIQVMNGRVFQRAMRKTSKATE